MSTKPKVLIAAPVHPVLTQGLTDLGYELLNAEKIAAKDAPMLIADCTGVITSTRLQLDEPLLHAAPLLRWIGRMGSGMEVIATDYANVKNIKYFSSPDGIANAVGEHAVGMLLNLIHKISHSNKELQHGIWKRDENRGVELEGSTIGIIGFGHTGRALARKLSGFDVEMLAYDINNLVDIPGYVTSVDGLEAIFDRASIISFHVPYKQDTHHYFDTTFLQRMKNEFVLINTSRGKICDTNSIYSGLQSGKIKGACLDVFEQEPINFESNHLVNNILSMSNVIATPHIAGYSFDALYKMSTSLLRQISQL